ncbi:hypothetical protein ACFQ1R_11175 [Mariniflexile jejuense]|uniref:MORN repeat protein n=1 Tax=Mariniflexile jejuense TaxID=1173582 RepID=A0ABW3JK58_9FLAO
MKQFIYIITALCFSNLFAQNVDLVNAPQNPIALKFKLEHFNLKGDVYCYDNRYYFNKEGLLTKKSDYQGDNTFTYKNGKLVNDSASNELKVNDQGYITSQKLTYSLNDYTYNEKGLLTSYTETRKQGYNEPLIVKLKKYTYDTQNRIVKEEEYLSNVLKSTKTFKYQKEGAILKVFIEEIKDSKTERSEKRYKEGRLTYSKSDFDNIELKVEAVLDAKANSIKDQHINNGTVTDTFDYSIVYYSDANKPIDYKIVIKKGANGNLYQHVYRNGNYFSTSLKSQLEGTNDLLFYDDLTQNYYLAKDAYNKTLTDGFNIKMELIAKNSEALLKNLPENKVVVFYQGKNVFLNSKISNSFSNENHIFSYHVDKKTFEEKTFFFKDAKDKIFVSGELLPENKDQFYYYLNGKTNKDFIVLKGKNISNTTYSNQVEFGDYGLLTYINNVPTYVFPDYYNMEKDKIYLARMYDEKSDLEILKNTKASTTTLNTTPKAPTPECVSGNCIDGYGEQKTINNSTFTGFFKNGKPNGFGKETYNDGSGFYEGTFKDGFRDGYGFYKWNSSGQYYIGQWQTGKQHGYGYFKKDTEVFQAGYYENGKQTRNMLTQNFINKQAVGNCIGDCTNGFGFYQYANNDKYVGFFTNSKRNYIGAYTWAGGNAFMGEFYNDQLTGQASEFYKVDESTYYGTFSNGKRHGFGAYFNKSNQLVSKGYWENGTLKTPY